MRSPIIYTAWGVGVASLVGVALSSSIADAKPRTCTTVKANQIQVDGMLDDWSGVRRHQIGRRGADGSFVLRCAIDGRRLYLSLNVRDEHVIRFRNTKPARNDHVTLKLTVPGSKAISLRLFPGVDKVKPRRFWAGRRVPRDVKIEDTLQKRGWSVEITIPFRRMRGLTKMTPALIANIVLRDYDIGRGKRRTTFADKLTFPGAAAQMRSFLRAAKLTRRQITLDKLVNMNSKRGPERVLVGGNVVGVLGDSFNYMRLPVRTARDVKKVRVVDLAGKGRHAIIVEYRQFGAGGSRDIVGVWYASDSGSINRVLAFEVRQQKGSNILRNTWKLTRPGKNRRLRRRRRRGRDIVVKAGKATGWDEDNYFIRPSRDVNPILLPWSDDTSSVYYFTGTRANVAKKTR